MKRKRKRKLNLLKKRFKKRFLGFTILELLIVAAIIGLLSSVVLVSLSQAKAEARDAKRQAGTHVIDIALKAYYAEYDHYPIASTGIEIEEQYANQTGDFYDTMKNTYLSETPEDPLYGSGQTYIDDQGVERPYSFHYVSDPEGEEYRIIAGTEGGAGGGSSSGGGEDLGWMGENSIEVSECGILDTPGYTYYLINDITNSEDQECLNISANDITLDCQGHTINAGYKDGIHLERVISEETNITINNCVISEGQNAIYLINANNNNLTNITSTGSNIEIYLRSSDSNAFSNINIEGSTFHGIKFEESCNFNTLSGIAIANSFSTGIYITQECSSNIFSDITINSCGNPFLPMLKGTGIYCSINSDSNIFSDITLSDNDYGFDIQDSDNNTIKNSIIKNNAEAGISLRFTGLEEVNKIYNNLFSNQNNYDFDGSDNQNEWSTDRQSGIRIFSPGTEIGGNYWNIPGGIGYSDFCDDADHDGFCDEPYDISGDGKNVDLLPLSNEYAL